MRLCRGGFHKGAALWSGCASKGAFLTFTPCIRRRCPHWVGARLKLLPFALPCPVRLRGLREACQAEYPKGSRHSQGATGLAGCPKTGDLTPEGGGPGSEGGRPSGGLPVAAGDGDGHWVCRLLFLGKPCDGRRSRFATGRPERVWVGCRGRACERAAKRAPARNGSCPSSRGFCLMGVAGRGNGVPLPQGTGPR